MKEKVVNALTPEFTSTIPILTITEAKGLEF
jgi:hypothetical protein